MTLPEKDCWQNLRARGYRVTPQRQLMLAVIAHSHGHITPEAIYKRVHAKYPAINLATIYRNLDFLCELRLVVATQIGRKMYYEIAGEEPHHHLVCRRCNQMMQIEHRALKSFFDKVERDQDFMVDMDHVTLFGVCAKCRAKH